VARLSSRRSASHGPGGSLRMSWRPTASHSNGEAELKEERRVWEVLELAAALGKMSGRSTKLHLRTHGLLNGCLSGGS
jgi:hypothetical protein